MNLITAIIIGGICIAMAGIIAHTVGVIAAAGDQEPVISRVGLPDGTSISGNTIGIIEHMPIEFFSGGQSCILTLPANASLKRIFVGSDDLNGSNTDAPEVGIYDVSGLTIPDDLEQAELLWSTTINMPNNSAEQYLQFDVDVDFSAHSGKDVAIAIATDGGYQYRRTAGSFYAASATPSGGTLDDPFSSSNVNSGNVIAIYGEFES